jgi:hypothetical protein
MGSIPIASSKTLSMQLSLRASQSPESYQILEFWPQLEAGADGGGSLDAAAPSKFHLSGNGGAFDRSMQHHLM